MTIDLIAWLRSQLDADEQTARAATPGPWETCDTEDVGVDQSDVDDGHLICEMERCPDHEDRRAADARHIATWDPCRALDEIAAKRAILALHVCTEHHGCAVCDRDDESCGCLSGGIEYPCRTLKHLARPYAGRDGWREEWTA